MSPTKTTAAYVRLCEFAIARKYNNNNSMIRIEQSRRRCLHEHTSVRTHGHEDVAALARYRRVSTKKSKLKEQSTCGYTMPIHVGLNYIQSPMRKVFDHYGMNRCVSVMSNACCGDWHRINDSVTRFVTWSDCNIGYYTYQVCVENRKYTTLENTPFIN